MSTYLGGRPLPTDDEKMFAVAALIGLCSSINHAHMDSHVRAEVTELAWKVGIAMAKGPK